MEYDLSDSSGTDDDLPPSHQSRGLRRGWVAGNGRVVGACSRAPNGMEEQIHHLEQEAYYSVLKAFKAQSDAITWEKEDLITELRKELRVSDREHRQLLSSVNADGTIRRMREWRQGIQSDLLNNAQPLHDSVPSPTVSASCKRSKISQALPSSSFGVPSTSFHSQQVAASMQPSTAKRGFPSGSNSKHPKTAGASSGKYSSVDPNGRGQPAEASTLDPLVGRKVLTRWPEDNNFYEALITNYHPEKGHALVYDMNTKNETWEWVNLSEISPDDIKWVGEDPGIFHPGHGSKKSIGRSGNIVGAGRGRGTSKNNAKNNNYPPSQNGIGKNGSDKIEILHTETVIKGVEKVFNTSNPDPLEIKNAKKMLEDQEKSLMDAIGRLSDVSDGESEEEQFHHGQYGGNQYDTMAGDRDGGSDQMDHQQSQEYDK